MAPHLRKLAKSTYVMIDPINILAYRLIHPHVRTIPPAINRMRVGSRSISRFMDAGMKCYRPIKDAIKNYYEGGVGKPRLLDFGCGVGRVLQYFCDDNFELYASDIDSTAIAYVRQAYPSVRSDVSSFKPPLPHDSNQLDIVYAVSVWTHIPPVNQEPWLREMNRVLRTGGLALLTTIGPHGYKKGTHLRDVTFSYDDLLRTGFQYSEYTSIASPGTGDSYGIAYHTPEYIRREWSRFFDVVDVQEGVIDNLNDLVILRNR